MYAYMRGKGNAARILNIGTNKAELAAERSARSYSEQISLGSLDELTKFFHTFSTSEITLYEP
jgi:hypothetical protein